mmetsp:Transcript_45281/g.98527  ORF Transcript_45281/g.98527 Transcript_45281/m.98527 type:complete len:487 (+) Transcript_45281:1-1461(+)
MKLNLIALGSFISILSVNGVNVGDGYCDQELNTAQHDFDNGDCCKDTCKGAGCSELDDVKDCKDPEVKPFTMIFMSDLESNYRGHTVKHAKRVVTYIRDLESEGLYFDGEYKDYKVVPELVVHGGDNTVDAWSCEMNLGFGCRDPSDEFRDVWNQLYDAGIPVLMGFGNHDWADLRHPDKLWERDYTNEEKTKSNVKTMEFIRKSFEKSQQLVASQGLGLKVNLIQPRGRYGQETAIVDYRGLQISMHMNHAFTESYDSETEYFSSNEQFSKHSEALDRSRPTVFVSHYPIHTLPSESAKTQMKSLLWAFDNAVHFSGHTHNQGTKVYVSDTSGARFIDYTAAYPHIWNGKAPGAYAVLVSGKRGVLQVKPFEIKPKSWKDGTRCVPFLSCKTECADNDKNHEFWVTKLSFACGKEPRLKDGTVCLKNSSCKKCANGYEFWEKYQMHACGKEPCWKRGTVCHLISRDNCCSSSKCPWYWFGGCKCT